MKYSHTRPFRFIRHLLIFLITVLSVICLPASGLAVKFIIKPMVNVSGRLDTNFFKTEKGEREVYTYLLAPGIQLGVETPKLEVLFNYTLEAYFYDDKSSVPVGEKPADDLDYVGHLLALNVRYRPFRRLTLGVDDSFYRTRYQTAYDRLSDSTDLYRYDINRLTPMIFYDFENRFSTGLRYRWTEIDYVDSGSSDSTEHRLIYNLIYDPNRTTTLDLECQIWTMDYDFGSSDYTSDQFKLIVQKRYKYFAFDAGAGYHMRSYDQSGLSDEDTFAYKVSILGQNPAPPEGRRFLGNIFLRPRSEFYLSAERNFNNLGSTYTAHRFTADAGHIFLEKIHVRVKGYYQMSDYARSYGLTPAGVLKKRSDDTYNVSGSVGYLFTERLELTLVGGIENRDSNLANADYNNKYLTLRFDFNFDFKSRGGFTDESLYY
ncbi:MAG: outer membrane beta-barrel protein [Deltaproteobacteria bacterium]|nr:outer membrane beta-barrel protein [Deltaproteobacteria bacterium]